MYHDDKEFQKSYEHYLDFKVAIAQAIAACRQPYTQKNMPVEAKKLVDEIESFLNATTRSTLLWAQLSDAIKGYAWHQYHFGPLSTFLKTIEGLLNTFPVLSLVQKDIMELEAANQSLGQRCADLEKNNMILRQYLNQANDPALPERYRKLELEKQQLELQNQSLIKENVGLLQRLTQLEQYNKQLMLDLDEIIKANQLLQNAHVELRTQHGHIIEQLKQTDEFKTNIRADIKLIKQKQSEHDNETKVLRKSLAEKDKHIEALTQQSATNAIKDESRSYHFAKWLPRFLTTNTKKEDKTPEHKLPSADGSAVHQPR